MDDWITKLKTPEECKIFEKNVTERSRPDLAVAARKRRLEPQAHQYNVAGSDYRAKVSGCCLRIRTYFV